MTALFRIFEEEPELDLVWKFRKAIQICEDEYKNRGNNTSYFTIVDGRKYSKEAVIRIYHQSSVNSNKIARYVLDVKKTKDKKLVFNGFGAPTNAETIEKSVALWNKMNSHDHRSYQARAKEREKKGKPPVVNKPRYTTHIVFSIKESQSKSRIEALKNCVSNVQLKYFSSFGFDSFFTIHKNTKHLHAHLIVHNKNHITNKKIDFKKAFTYSLRKDFANSLRENGLNYYATLKNIDSLEAKNNPRKKRANRKDYLTNNVVKEFGDEIIPFVKKQRYEAKSEDPKKAKRAEDNLTLMHNIHDPTVKLAVLHNWEKYKSQKEKFEIKTQIVDAHPDLAEEDIHSYVDMVFAKRNKLLASANSKNPRSVERFNDQERIFERLPVIDKEEVIKFSAYRKKKKLNSDEKAIVGNYGEPGKEYYRLLVAELKANDKQITKDLKDVKYLEKAIKIQSEIKDMRLGKLDQDKLLNKLFYRNIKGQESFLVERLRAYRDDLAEDCNVDKTSIDLKNIYKFYLMKRGSKPKWAYNAFELLIDEYRRMLKSYNQKGIESMQRQLAEKLKPKSNNLTVRFSKGRSL